MVVYAMKAVLTDEATIEDIFRGSFPFLVMIFIVLIILIVFPWLSTFLPGLM
jgi:TRAP-type mannitol/chloroaromatic compound transport system permease large subunit